MISTELEEIHLYERQTFETTYFNTIATLERYIQNLRGPARSTTSTHTPSPVLSEAVTLRLPTITLPAFDGNFDNWLRFRDTFESLIHNNEVLTDIQKFHYLTSALKGPAARMIGSLGVSEANYKFAWHSLKNRYEDSQALAIHHADALIELVPIKKPSGIAIREFIDTVNNHILALGALGLPVKAWDLLVVLILSKKLDPASRIEWEKKALQSQGFPKFREFIDILEQRSRLLERTKPVVTLPSSSGISDGNRVKTRSQLTVSSHVASTSNQCTSNLCSDAKLFELHGFADASERAYGACIYIRTLLQDNTWFVRLLCCVALLKTISLPCLELCAALLLSRLADKIKRALKLDFSCERYWSDSTITLAWIQNPSSRSKTFVANRTSEIQQLTSAGIWNHVISEQNPADILSRVS